MQKPLLNATLTVLFFLSLLTGSGFGQPVPQKPIFLEGAIYQEIGHFAPPYGTYISIGVGRHAFGLVYGFGGHPLIKSNELALHYRYAFAREAWNTRFAPFVLGRAGVEVVENASFFFHKRSVQFLSALRLGCKWTFWNGVHLTGEAGIGIQRIWVDDIRHFAERTWVTPTVVLGVGYTLRLRPWERLNPDYMGFLKDELPPRHSLRILVSKASFSFFVPTLEYRLQYGYTVHPVLDIYGGVDAATTRWFFPRDPVTDSVQVLGGRVGGRLFPVGRGRLQFFADASFAYGRRLVVRGGVLWPGSTNLRFTVGNGLNLRLWNELYATTTFFHTTFWVFPKQFGLRLIESGVDIGLAYRFR